MYVCKMCTVQLRNGKWGRFIIDTGILIIYAEVVCMYSNVYVSELYIVLMGRRHGRWVRLGWVLWQWWLNCACRSALRYLFKRVCPHLHTFWRCAYFE